MPNDSPPDSIVGSAAADAPSHERRRRAGTTALGAFATDLTLVIETGGTSTDDFTRPEAAVTRRPASVEQWRQTTALFGAADWDTGVLAHAAVVDANDGGDAEAAVAGDMAAAVRIGVAGVVAVRAAGQLFEVEESVDGWALERSSGTPDVADLAMAAAIRATQLAAQRRRQESR